MTMVEVRVGEEGILFPDGQTLGWDVVTRIQGSDVGCFLLEEGALGRRSKLSPNTPTVTSA